VANNDEYVSTIHDCSQESQSRRPETTSEVRAGVWRGGAPLPAGGVGLGPTKFVVFYAFYWENYLSP